MSRGLNKLAIFKEKREKTRMLNLIRENLSNYNVEIYAYCIMSNHFHLLIKADLEELASFMAKVLAAFAKYYNFKHNRIGYVFQDRYKSQRVENMNYFWACLRYIHNNPGYAENVEELLSYKHSSMKEFFCGKQDILADTIFLLVDKKFASLEEFLIYHKKEDWSVFADIPEEAFRNNMRIAEELLEDFSERYEICKIEVLDYNKTRHEFEDELAGILCVSLKYISNIVKILREELREKG